MRNGMRVIGLATVLGVAIGLSGCATTSTPAIATSNKHTQRIAQALPQYAKLSRKKWPRLSSNRLLKPGMHSQIIPIIRDRLIMLGDMPNKYRSKNTLFGPELAKAMKQFQWRHGLKPDAEIGEKTLAALNVPPKKRLKQLKTNMVRWSKVPTNLGEHYVKINIPSYELDIVKDGSSVEKMRVVVGKPSRPTPQLYSKVRTIVFNPRWNVPETIANKDIIPKVIQDQNYLADNDISIYSSWAKNAYEISPDDINWDRVKRHGFKYKFVQESSGLNPLGRVKFIFLNKHDVYMHDTPQKGLFDKIQRAYSSGCIRVEKPFRLVEYFIKDNEHTDQSKVTEILQNKDVKYIRIKNPIPIYITYITAWVDKNGQTHFREDIYHLDNTKQ